MKRLALALLFAFTVSAPLEAGPLHWAKHHKRFLIMESVAVTASVVHLEGMRHCRTGNVEHCDEHYGAANAFFWVNAGMSTVAMPALAESCWKNDGGKLCYALGYGWPAYQFATGIRDFRTYFPKEKE